MTYPFVAEPTAYPGALPDEGADWDIRSHRFWLGDPESVDGMIELPSPDPSSYTPGQTRGRVAHGLAANTTAVSTFAGTTRTWPSIAWQRLAGFEWDVINGFDSGLFGDGPWCFVPPEDRNRLTRAQSLCGRALGVVEGWAANTNQPVYQPEMAAQIRGGGVMRWDAATNEVLTATFDPHYSPPYLPGEPFAWFAWCSSTDGTAQVAARVSGRTADGTVTTSITGDTVTLSTTPRLVLVTADELALAGSVYVTPRFVAVTGGPVFISCPGFDYRDAPGDWTPGRGVPRVQMPVDLDITADVHLNRAVTMQLAESWAGAA